MRKKGYALAMVVVSMAVVMALSSLVLALLSNSNHNQKIQVKNFENSLYISEISTVYANKSLNNFISYCEHNNWLKTVDGQNIKLQNANNSYTITILANEQTENFEFKQNSSQKLVAKIHKTIGVVDGWQYF